MIESISSVRPNSDSSQTNREHTDTKLLCCLIKNGMKLSHLIQTYLWVSHQKPKILSLKVGKNATKWGLGPQSSYNIVSDCINNAFNYFCNLSKKSVISPNIPEKWHVY